MAWIDDIIGMTVQQAGTSVGQRNTINVGAGLTAVDDAPNGRINIGLVNVPDVGFNPMNYGAAGNGTTDDSAAVVAACVAAGWSGTLYLPRGKKFRVASTQTIAVGRVVCDATGIFEPDSGLVFDGGNNYSIVTSEVVAPETAWIFSGDGSSNLLLRLTRGIVASYWWGAMSTSTGDVTPLLQFKVSPHYAARVAIRALARRTGGTRSAGAIGDAWTLEREYVISGRTYATIAGEGDVNMLGDYADQEDLLIAAHISQTTGAVVVTCHGTNDLVLNWSGVVALSTV